MKKNILFFVLVIGISSIFVSCSKSDSNNSPSIVGKWEYSQEGEILNNQEVLTDYQNTSGCEKDFVEFKSDNSFSDVNFNLSGSVCSPDITTGTYTQSGNSIITTSGNLSVTNQIITVNTTTLKVKYTSDSHLYVNVFTKTAN